MKQGKASIKGLKMSQSRKSAPNASVTKTSVVSGPKARIKTRKVTQHRNY